MKIPNFDVSNASNWKELQRYASQILTSVIGSLNSGLLFSDNFDANIQSVVFASANVEVKVTHRLGRVVAGYLPLSLSAAAIIYSGTSASDANNVYLKASSACTASIMIF